MRVMAGPRPPSSIKRSPNAITPTIANMMMTMRKTIRKWLMAPMERCSVRTMMPMRAWKPHRLMNFRMSANRIRACGSHMLVADGLLMA